jgi:hypothetical protein
VHWRRPISVLWNDTDRSGKSAITHSLELTFHALFALPLQPLQHRISHLSFHTGSDPRGPSTRGGDTHTASPARSTHVEQPNSSNSPTSRHKEQRLKINAQRSTQDGFGIWPRGWISQVHFFTSPATLAPSDMALTLDSSS